VETGRLTPRDSLIHRVQEFERSIFSRFFKKIIMDVIPGMQPDAEEFLNLFLESDEYKVMAARYTNFWPDGFARVTTHHGAIVDPTPGQQRTVDAMEVAECTGVYDDVKERRVKCDRGPLDFVKRFRPVAENEAEADNEYDRENETGAGRRLQRRGN
jgi:hypothetical protein